MKVTIAYYLSFKDIAKHEAMHDHSVLWCYFSVLCFVVFQECSWTKSKISGSSVILMLLTINLMSSAKGPASWVLSLHTYIHVVQYFL